MLQHLPGQNAKMTFKLKRRQTGRCKTVVADVVVESRDAAITEGNGRWNRGWGEGGRGGEQNKQRDD